MNCRWILLFAFVVLSFANKCPYGFDDHDGFDDLKTATAKGPRSFQRDFAGWLDKYAGEFITWEERRSGLVMRGKEELIAWEAGWGKASSDLVCDTTWAMRSGDVVNAHWKCIGTFDGQFGAVKGTGKRFTLQGSNTIIWAAGKISHVMNFWDASAFWEQTGVASDPAVTGSTAISTVPLTSKCVESHFRKLWDDPNAPADVSDYTESSVVTLTWDKTAYKGLDAIQKLYTAYKKAFSEIKFEIRSFVAGVNSAAVDLECSVAKVVADMGQMKASNKPTSFSCSVFWDNIQGDKILSARWQCDWINFVRDGGALAADPIPEDARLK